MSGRPADPKLEIATYTELIRQVFRLSGQFIMHGDEIARAEGLTTPRWIVLGELADKPKTVAHIARNLEIARQSVQRTVNWIVDAGLAELVDNPRHRRAKLVQLTAAGEMSRTRLRPSQEKWAAEVIDGLPCDELEATVAMLQTIRKRLSHQAQIIATATPAAAQRDV